MNQFLQNVSLNQIQIIENTRKTFNEKSLKELAQSIKTNGVLEPIIVNKQEDGKYHLIAGERRVRASLIAGLVVIPAVVREESDQNKILQWQITENLQREGLNYMEEARAIIRLRDEASLDMTEICKMLGKSDAYIYNQIQLCAMPESVQSACDKEFLTKSVAWLICRLKNSEDQIKACSDLAREAKDKRISYSTARKYLAENFGENRITVPKRNYTQKTKGNDYQANWKKYLLQFDADNWEAFKGILRGRTATQDWAEAVDILKSKRTNN